MYPGWYFRYFVKKKAIPSHWFIICTINDLISVAYGLPGLPGSIRRLNCHGWPSAGEKSLIPPHIPQMIASPCLNSHSTQYSYPHRLLHPMPCTPSSLSCTCTTIYRFLISPSVPASLGTCFFLNFSIQSWKFIHHSKLTHDLTPPSMQKSPLNIPVISHCIQIPP